MRKINSRQRRSNRWHAVAQLRPAWLDAGAPWSGRWIVADERKQRRFDRRWDAGKLGWIQDAPC